jgi:amino-acid N-acetyltransferase
MQIRPAKISDARDICALINYYAERGRMLHRSLESVYDCLREFHVATGRGKLLGCVAVDVFWANLAEVKSLAVSPTARGRGIGGKLIESAIADAKSLGIKKLFALTYEKEFFLKQGFRVIDRQKLPDKVWRECIACPKAEACDEIAMVLPLSKRAKTAAKGKTAG